MSVHYLLDSRWLDRRETLHVNRVGHSMKIFKVQYRLHFANWSYMQK